MERISQKFKSLQDRGETAFIPFSVAGFPSPEKSLEIFLKLADVDVLDPACCFQISSLTAPYTESVN
jgi:tryptophan synthase alpha subunit